MKQIKLALHWQMCIALILGAMSGFALGGYFEVWGNFVNGISRLFLNAINMIVIPLVFLSSLLGVSSMKEGKMMGRIAFKTFLYFTLTAIVAALIGIIIADALKPGCDTHAAYIEADQIIAEAESEASKSIMDRIVEIVPSNVFNAFSAGNILPILFFSLIMGWFISKAKATQKDMINTLFDSFLDVIMRMTSVIIRFAPIGIFAIVMTLVGEMVNDGDSLKNRFLSFAFFILVVWICLIIMGGIVLPIIVGMIANISPLKHLRQIYSALMVAFSTSSSYSALPLILRDVREKFGVSNDVASFTVPLGITFNKTGTIIYECVAVIFVAQAFGIDLNATQQISLIGVSIVMVLGSPSVPMAGVIVLAVLLKAMDLPNTYIGMFMAVDILCDMPKTLLNAYSVSCGAIIVARSEGEELLI